MNTTLELAQQLINLPSITPNDHGCQKLLSDYLQRFGFSIVDLSSNGVSNLWATHGSGKPLFVFSGHTDVVPPGDETEWDSPPFYATIRDQKLYGRGAADMKSAVAAMSTAVARFLQKYPHHVGTIAFMITSDEEGNATNGTAKIIDHLKQKQTRIDYCLIGEASSNQVVGDAIKVGRRGSLHGALTVFGKQGHIAYPQQAINPIHRSFQALDALTNMTWDTGNELFTPTSFQIYNINADTGANNVIPGSLTARFNFRYAPTSTAEQLQSRTEEVFRDHELQYAIDWQHASKPFFSKPGLLMQACQQAIQEICHITTEPNTSGGTSDGRFIAPTGAEVVELGLCSDSIHQVNEYTKLADLNTLSILYEKILEKLMR